MVQENSTAAFKASRKRRPQERAEVTKRKLLEVAKRKFTQHDFDAVTIREIEVEAGVQRNLLKYHYGSKDEIWKNVAKDIFENLDRFMESRQEVMRDLPPRERMSYTIRSFSRFSAGNPELHRLMIQEGKQDSWRLRWILDNHIREMADELREMVGRDVGIADSDFVHWYYLFAGGVPVMFSNAPEAKLLFGVDVSTEEVIKRHADLMVNLLLSLSTD
ncbi:MAG: TetR/AcrR family transcriptional regulator [Pseudomonadota bacterium]